MWNRTPQAFPHGICIIVGFLCWHPGTGAPTAFNERFWEHAKIYPFPRSVTPPGVTADRAPNNTPPMWNFESTSGVILGVVLRCFLFLPIADQCNDDRNDGKKLGDCRNVEIDGVIGKVDQGIA